MSILDHFAVKTIIPIRFMGHNLSFTNSSLAMMGGFLLTIICFIIMPRFIAKARVFMEIYYDFICGIVMSNIGEKGMFLAPFISGLFLTILFGNLIGLFPHSYTFTANFPPNFFLAVTVVGLSTIIGFSRHGLSFLNYFCPADIPGPVKPFVFALELLTFLIRVPMLTLRLGLSMTIGHMIINSFLLVAEALGSAGLSVGVLYIMILGIELLTALLQAYIFCILSCIYLGNGVDYHH